MTIARCGVELVFTPFTYVALQHVSHIEQNKKNFQRWESHSYMRTATATGGSLSPSWGSGGSESYHPFAVRLPPA
eukprot:scaffold1906_cov403-Prasinococcus_capsulatus_cf.AAC.8